MAAVVHVFAEPRSSWPSSVGTIPLGMVWIMHTTTRMFGHLKAIGHAATLWAHAGRTQRLMVSAAIGTIFVQDSADAALAQWRSVAGQLRGKFAKLGALLDDAEDDLLGFMTFPWAHWTQIFSIIPLERLNAEIKRRTNVGGIFPNGAPITRIIGAMMRAERGPLLAA